MVFTPQINRVEDHAGDAAIGVMADELDVDVGVFEKKEERFNRFTSIWILLKFFGKGY